MLKENEFYLRDTRSNVGTSCTFWCKNGHGYASDLDKAEVFNFEAAQKHADRSGHFIPLSKSKVDAVAVLRVDMQYLKLSTDFSLGVVVQQRLGSYDGNDIFFYNGVGASSPDYNMAKVLSLDEVDALGLSSGAVYSKKFLDTICRRIIQVDDVNMRRMVTNSGIRYRQPRRSKSTGKYRGNCPVCGRLTWSYYSEVNEFCAIHDQFDLDRRKW